MTSKPNALKISLRTILFVPTVVRAQTIEVVPNRVLQDEIAAVHVGGLQPKERIVIQASLVDGAGQSWTSRAAFVADADGKCGGLRAGGRAVSGVLRT